MFRTASVLAALTVLGSLSGCNQGGSGDGTLTTLTGLSNWATTYGGAGTDRAHDVRQTEDGGYVIAGETESFGPGEKDFWVMKQDVDGNVVWSRAYGDGNILLTGNSGLGVAWSANGALDSRQVAVAATPGGGCLAAGARFDGWSDDGVNRNGPIFQIVAVKLDARGHVEWRRVYPGGERGGRALAVERVASGGWVLAGYVEARGGNRDSRNRDALVLRIDGDGRELWRHVEGEGTHEAATCIQEDGDGGFVVGVNKRVESDEDPDSEFVTLLKIDSTGQSRLWLRNFFEGAMVRVYGLRRSADGARFTAAGVVQDEANHSYDSNDGSFDVWAANVRGSDGGEEWNERFESNGDFTSAGDAFFAVERRGAGFLLAGYAGILSRDGWVMELDAGGDLVAARSFGAEHRDELHAIRRTADGGYIASGFRGVDSDANFPRQDAWLLKLNEDLSPAWERTFTFPGSPFGQASRSYTVDEAPGGEGYVLAGAGPVGGWVIRTDAEGNERWRRSVNDLTNEVARAVVETEDGGYLVAGHAESFQRTGRDAWVLKLDDEGRIEWQETVGGPGDDEVSALIRASGGDYLAAGSTCSASGECGDFGDRDAWVFRIDARGLLVWQRAYGDADGETFNNDGARDIVETEAGFLVAGEGFGSGGCGGGFAFAILEDGSLDPAWPSLLRFCGKSPRRIAATGDGDHLLVGTLFRGDATPQDDLWVARIGPSGEVFEEITYGGEGEEEGVAIAPREDGAGWVAAGRTRSFGGGEECRTDFGELRCSNIWFLLLEPDLSIARERTYATALEDRAAMVRATRDGGFIIAGETDTAFLAEAEARRGIDAWILKVEDDGGVCGLVSGDSSAEVRDETDGGSRPGALPEERSTASMGAAATPVDEFRADPRVDTICFSLLEDFELTVEIAGQGRVTSDPQAIDCTATCSARIPEGTRVVLAAEPAAGWELDGFGEECREGAVRMNRDRNCTVTFRRAGDAGELDITGYWTDSYECRQRCGEDPPEPVEGAATITIEREGNRYRLTDLDSNFEAVGTLDGRVFTWSGTSELFDGRVLTESGTFTFSEDGRTFTKSTEYEISGAPGVEPCTATCTGSGTRIAG